MKDLFGKAIYDHHFKSKNEKFFTSTSISDKEELPLEYLFRNFEQMPKLEQLALELSRGNILDIGCGTGSHSLYLQNKNFNVRSIDSSSMCIDVAKDRGILNASATHLLQEQGRYDSILLLMNGTGIFETFDKSKLYLNHLKDLLNPGGQILIDSSDIIYMFPEEDKPSRSDRPYYGELDYFLHYGNDTETLKWLYLDEITFARLCAECGMKLELIQRGEHFDYLAKLTILS